MAKSFYRAYRRAYMKLMILQSNILKLCEVGSPPSSCPDSREVDPSAKSRLTDWDPQLHAGFERAQPDMSKLRVARDSSRKVRQTCTETNENCKCTPRSSGSYPGLETSGNKELCRIMVANRALTALTVGCSLLSAQDRRIFSNKCQSMKLLEGQNVGRTGVEVALREARAR